jgi:hypothetical protein
MDSRKVQSESVHSKPDVREHETKGLIVIVVSTDSEVRSEEQKLDIPSRLEK